MPGAHKCIVCGRKLSEDTSRHYFKDTWPADVRAAIAPWPTTAKRKTTPLCAVRTSMSRFIAIFQRATHQN
jgi:hypothetical protein